MDDSFRRRRHPVYRVYSRADIIILSSPTFFVTLNSYDTFVFVIGIDIQRLIVNNYE